MKCRKKLRFVKQRPNLSKLRKNAIVRGDIVERKADVVCVL